MCVKPKTLKFIKKTTILLIHDNTFIAIENKESHQRHSSILYSFILLILHNIKYMSYIYTQVTDVRYKEHWSIFLRHHYYTHTYKKKYYLLYRVILENNTGQYYYYYYCIIWLDCTQVTYYSNVQIHTFSTLKCTH